VRSTLTNADCGGSGMPDPLDYPWETLTWPQVRAAALRLANGSPSAAGDWERAILQRTKQRAWIAGEAELPAQLPFTRAERRFHRAELARAANVPSQDQPAADQLVQSTEPHGGATPSDEPVADVRPEAKPFAPTAAPSFNSVTSPTATTPATDPSQSPDESPDAEGRKLQKRADRLERRARSRAIKELVPIAEFWVRTGDPRVPRDQLESLTSDLVQRMLQSTTASDRALIDEQKLALPPEPADKFEALVNLHVDRLQREAGGGPRE
jgi:hypothetical protein